MTTGELANGTVGGAGKDLFKQVTGVYGGEVVFLKIAKLKRIGDKKHLWREGCTRSCGCQR